MISLLCQFSIGELLGAQKTFKTFANICRKQTQNFADNSMWLGLMEWSEPGSDVEVKTET